MDNLTAPWAELNEKLDRAYALNLEALRETPRRRATFSLAGFKLVRMLEVGFGVVVVGALGSIYAGGPIQPVVLLSTILVHLAMIGLMAGSVWQLVLASRVDLSGAILETQQQMAGLGLAGVRTNVAALALGTLLWVPVLVVLARLLGGPETARIFDPSWVVANLLLGGAAIPIVMRLARRAERKNPSAFLEAMSGTALKRAARSVEELDALR